MQYNVVFPVRVVEPHGHAGSDYSLTLPVEAPSAAEAVQLIADALHVVLQEHAPKRDQHGGRPIGVW
jgi:hypothetical protein